MSTAGTFSLNQALSFQAFGRLREVLQQMAEMMGADRLLLTEELLEAARVAPVPGVDWFVVLVSGKFNVLLQASALTTEEDTTSADPTSVDTQILHKTRKAAVPALCRVSLTFVPEAIALFLQHLEAVLQAKPVLVETLAEGRSRLQVNDADLQSEFTLRAIAALDGLVHSGMLSENAKPSAPKPVQQRHETLEEEILIRTQELQDAMLTAQSATHAKSQFLAAISHELRTPLTAIIGMSSTLLRWSFGQLSQRQRSFLQTIHSSGQHLLELINDILDISQLEDGKTGLKLSTFSLSLLAQQTLKELQDTAKSKGIELNLDLRVSASFDQFVADPQRVRQILLNLLSNAVKFTPEGGTVTLRVFADQHLAIFRVHDTGIGISEDQRSLLFQKFQQLDTSYHRMYQGAGLGLALTKQLVELHGGRISLESTVGVGSVFTVHLPARPAEVSVPAAIPLETGSNHLLGRIVLIESHEESANIICDLLTAAGYQLIWMLEGSMAMRQIETIQPLVVITDVQSGDSQGYELMRYLRQNPATKNTKVIALIGKDATQDGPFCLTMGADDYLTKPIQPDQVLPKVFALTVSL